MADLNVQRTGGDDHHVEPSNMEITLWVLGILAIPLVPILMVVFLTPYSGM